MQLVKYIKSFSRGQITIPKELREELGVPEEFWMKIYSDNGKIVAEPIEEKPKHDQAEYLKKLLAMKTDWFTKESEEEIKSNRAEIEKQIDER